MAWDRHDHTIYLKVTKWFSIVSEELARPDVLAENVYNMDETGVDVVRCSCSLLGHSMARSWSLNLPPAKPSE
jgi:hypothetical protein